MLTDKTSNNNNSHQIPNKKPPNLSTKIKKCFYQLLFILFIIASFSIPFNTQSSESPQDQQVIPPTIPQEPEKPKIDIIIDEAIELSMQLKRSKILVSPTAEQTLPMLVSLKFPGLELPDRKPFDLVCLIDSSESLTSAKMKFIKRTLRYLLSFLGDEDRISIVTFNEEASILVPLTIVTTENKSKILSSLNALHSKGRSNTRSGIDAARRIFKRGGDSFKIKAVLLISEALDNQKDSEMSNCIKDKFALGPLPYYPYLHASSPPITIQSLMGYDISPNFFLIDKLDKIDQVFRFIENLSILQTRIGIWTKFMIKAEFEDPELYPFLGSRNHPEIVKAYGDESMWREDEGLFITQSPDFITRRRKDFVLDLKIPRFPESLPRSPMEVTLANCEVILTLSDNRKVIKKANLTVTLVQDEAELDSEKDNQEVVKHYSRVKWAETLNEAAKLVEEGKYEEAKQALKDCKEFLENCDLKDDALIKKMVKVMEESMGPESEYGWKHFQNWLGVNLRGYSKVWMRQDLDLDSNFVLKNTAFDHPKYSRYF